MGVVYKAKDIRLDRTVALKVLPEHLATTPERKERFEREARAISQLNHPHICTLHDVGSQDGIDFLVMEYLEGETLAERLRKGSLPHEKALEFAVQISDGLTEAHRAGIVHRDLKPGNVMLTKSGVKLLDFGLAKLVKGQPVSGESDALTEERTLVGTIRYMAPEQLEGKAVDARADLWAFGVVLYEMLTGKSAFDGGSPASLMSAILKDEPVSLRELQPLSPRSLERVVQKCLKKDPDDRWQSARDLKDEIVWIGAGDERTDAGSAPRSRRWMPFVATAAVSILATLLLWSLLRQDRLYPPTVRRFAIDLPSGQSLAASGAWGIAISPDGDSVVFPIALDDGRTQLYWRSIGNLQATPLRGTEGAVNPFFSPDGEWVAFYADGSLKKVPLVDGASSTPICATPDVYGASWEPDGTIWFSNGSLHRVSSSGGQPEPVTYSGEPALTGLGGGLPGGKALLLVASGNAGPVVGALSLESLAMKVLLEGGVHPRYASSGHIVFEAGGTLMAAPFDPVRLELRGPALPVLQDVRAISFGNRSSFDLSKEGTLVYIPSVETTDDNVPLHWVDRTGAMTLAIEVSEQLLAPRLSPDGRSIAMQKGTDIWTLDLARDALTRLTLGEGVPYAPVWSHDGSRLFFSSVDAISWRAVDGRGNVEQLIRGSFVPTSASSDGKTLVFSRLSERGGWDVGTISLEGDGEPRVVLGTRFNESFAVLSPDDRFLAYVSDESGRPEVYLIPFRVEGGRIPVSIDGGTEPMWSRDGRELYYRKGDQMMAVSISPEAEPELGKPLMLFQGHFRQGTRVAQYDVSADGRFLMVGENSIDRIHVVLNWFEDLKRLAPIP
jgi:eukaryotic-like serine/threonine-protein kinase